MVGAGGVAGCAFTNMEILGGDTHPSELVSVKVKFDDAAKPVTTPVAAFTASEPLGVKV